MIDDDPEMSIPKTRQHQLPQLYRRAQRGELEWSDVSSRIHVRSVRPPEPAAAQRGDAPAGLPDLRSLGVGSWIPETAPSRPVVPVEIPPTRAPNATRLGDAFALEIAAAAAAIPQEGEQSFAEDPDEPTTRFVRGGSDGDDQ